MGNCEYPGDSHTKRQARDYLYRRLVSPALPLPKGSLITLAGKVPFDVPHLRDALRANPKDTWLVDTKPKGLRLAEEFWPQVNTYHGPLLDVIQHLSAIAFANLDFMGPYLPRYDGKGPEPCVKAMQGKLLPGAVVSLTFLACREDEDRAHNRRVLSLGKKLGGKTLDKQRWLGTFAAMQEDIGAKLNILGALKYFHGKSAMGMLVVQVPRK